MSLAEELNTLPLRDDDPEAVPAAEAEEGAYPPEEGEEEEPQLPSFFIHRDEVIGIIADSIDRLKAASAAASAAREAEGKAPLPYRGAVVVDAIGTDPSGVQAALFKMEHLLSAYQGPPRRLSICAVCIEASCRED